MSQSHTDASFRWAQRVKDGSFQQSQQAAVECLGTLSDALGADDEEARSHVSHAIECIVCLSETDGLSHPGIAEGIAIALPGLLDKLLACLSDEDEYTRSSSARAIACIAELSHPGIAEGMAAVLPGLLDKLLVHYMDGEEALSQSCNAAILAIARSPLPTSSATVLWTHLLPAVQRGSTLHCDLLILLIRHPMCAAQLRALPQRHMNDFVHALAVGIHSTNETTLKISAQLGRWMLPDNDLLECYVRAHQSHFGGTADDAMRVLSGVLEAYGEVPA